MKILRWIGLTILILIMGYLSGFALFADGTAANLLTVIVIFLIGCAAVGALLPQQQWYISALCGWGGMLMVILELSTRIGRDPIPGTQSTGRLLLTFIIVLGLALLGGFAGSQLRQKAARITSR